MASPPATPAMPTSPEVVTPQFENNFQDITKIKRMRRKRNKWTLIVTFLSLILIIIFITIAYLVSKNYISPEKVKKDTNCHGESTCSIKVVETVPKVLKYVDGSPSHDAISSHWKTLTATAQTNIDILSFYWTLSGSDIKGPYPDTKVGEDILSGLVAAANRGVKIRIVQGLPSAQFPQNNTKELAKNPNVEVRSLNMSQLVGAGIIHTKAWITDQQHAYVGSANFDWRALTEVKELGTVMYNCSCTVQDLQKIFEVNWVLAKEQSAIPKRWPSKYRTDFSKDSPMKVDVMGSSPAKLYWSTSPPQFCAGARTTDLNAILDIIKKAKKFVYIAVMDYYAAIIYKRPKEYWAVIDNALRAAVFDRGIQVYMLSSRWNHTNQQQVVFLKSLQAFGEMSDIHNGTLKVKMFTMPWTDIPFSRVNHNKYMVTDNAAFVSTSNWSGDYFVSTGGISLVINQTSTFNSQSIQEQLRLVFLRDWNSQYALPL